jgi:hypothetical protein
MITRLLLVAGITLAAAPLNNWMYSTPLNDWLYSGPLPNAVKMSHPVRIVTADSLQPDITAKELAQILSLRVTYMDDGWTTLTANQKAMIERNSRPAD